MLVQPYLFFDGRCEEAVEFYRRALGAEVEMLMRFRDGPEPAQPGMVPPGAEDKIMHAAFHIGDTQVMASDGQCSGKASFSGIALTLNAASNSEAEKLFNALAQGGKVNMPMSETFFAHRFGMVADKFGVGWMVLNPKQPG